MFVHNDRRWKTLPLIASWAKYLTSMSVSVDSFSSTGFTSAWRALWDKEMIEDYWTNHLCWFIFSHILEQKHPILKLQQQHTCCQGRGRSFEGTWPHWSEHWPPGHWTSWGPLVASALWWCPGHMPLTKPAIHHMIVNNDDNRILINT